MNAAQRYEAWFGTPFGRRAERVERRIMASLMSEFMGATCILEVGCGTGHFAGLWSSLGMRPVGLDASEEMLAFARYQPGLSLVRGDAAALPFSDASFDIVALVTALEFLKQPEVALKEAARIARRGLLLGVLNRLSPIAFWRRLRRTAAYHRARFLSPWGLARLVRSSLNQRRTMIRWKTGLYPVGWVDSVTFLPFGAFIGMSVSFV